MNKIYKSKWNNSSNQWVAVSELAKGKGKSSRLCKTILNSALVALGLSTVSLSYAGVIDNSLDINTTAPGAYPISDIVADGTNTDITNTGSLSTDSGNTNAIYVDNSTGQTVINNQGNVSTAGIAANVIGVKSSAGNIVINNTGNITATGQESTGIIATTSNGTITINDLGGHTITATSAGILLGAGNATSTVGEAKVTSNSQITIDTGSSITAKYAAGIDIAVANTNSTVIYDGPGISVTSSTENTGANIIGIRSASSQPTGTGHAEVTASGNIDVNLNNGDAHLIYGIESLNLGSGDAVVHYKSGTINVNANGSTVDFGRGLLAQSTGASSTGSAKIITDNGTQIHTIGNDVVAIGLTSTNGTSANGKIVYADIDSTITTNGNRAYGISAVAGKNALIDIIHRGSITTQNINSHAINLTSSSGEINVVNIGNILTHGENSIGILSTNNGTQPTYIYNAGKIETSGKSAFGIKATANAQGGIEITNDGQIITNNASGHGIYAYRGTSGGDVTINNNGLVHISGPSDSRAILVSDNSNDASTITINNTGTVIHDVDANGHYGIDALVKNNASVVVSHSGSISGGQFGIVVWSGNAANTNSQGIINIASTGRIDSGNALTMDLSNSNTMNIAQGAVVNGWRNALLFRTDSAVTPINTVNNAGTVTSELDKLLSTRYHSAGVQTIINNTATGNMSGFITTDQTDVTVNNAGLWNLRNFSDSTGNHVRDTKGVAINDFGSGTSSVNNTGILNLAAVSGNTSFNTAGEYVPLGALSIAHAGTVQGQMLNLNTFENSGLIDMTANNQAGDVLVITGAAVAGNNGGGTFISNGGTLKMNTLLNQGGTASLTDMLVLDDVQVGAKGATKIYITPTANSVGGNTTGDGIQIIQTMGTQDASAFTLGNTLVSGAYEYKLYATNAAGNMNGWYLRTNNGGVAFLSPNIGSYLANQYATGSMFNQNILDRRESVRNTNKNIWMRTNFNKVKSDLLGGLQHAEVDSSIVQVGIDLVRHEEFTAGTYIGYGHTKTKNRSKQTGTETGASADGYQAGIYGTWMPDENKGPYVDIWGHYAWYRNKLEGRAQQNKEVNYNSHGYALSIEGGYGFDIAQSSSGSTWIIQPHAQLIYNSLNTKDFTDKNYTNFSGKDVDGVQTRLGARLYGQRSVDQKGVLPFIEANWLYNGIKSNVEIGKVNYKDHMGRNVAEVKVGFQGKLSDSLGVFAHIGGQRAEHGYKRSELQIGINVDW